GLEVADADRDVRPHAGVGDLAGRVRDRQQRYLARADFLPQPLDLVRPLAESAVEDLGADGDEIRVRDPGAVEAVARLALLVLAHFGERDLVRLGVLAGRDEGRHAADRVRPTPVAGADEQLRV